MADLITVRPQRINDVLVNPGMGFTTFQRFNGDDLNAGVKWTEGTPIEYQDEKTSLIRPDYPFSSIAYLRVYWRYLEPERGAYNWSLIDRVLETARARKQELMLRVAPYGTHDENDVPAWYRALVGPNREWNGPSWNYEGGPYWMVDANDPRYQECFGGFIRELGKRYDGHPDLDSVDVSIVGSWGEGIDGGRMTQGTRIALLDSYLDTFSRTPLMMLLEDPLTNSYPLTKRDVGLRFDCLGDMGEWEHMMRIYPFTLIENGLENAWKKGPVSLEACWVMKHWQDKGWDIDYIIEQSLKWHMSSFNNKSCAVPVEWWPKVNDWLKRMGYRLALRRLECEGSVARGGKLDLVAWWENLGVAPCYKNYLLAYRLRGETGSHVVVSDADLRSFMPGDTLHRTKLHLPAGVPAGRYTLDVAIVDKPGYTPRVKLATEGLREDGWYGLGAEITVLDA